MNIKEKFQKFIENKILNKEMKKAKSEISERFERIKNRDDNNFEKNLNEKITLRKKKLNLEKVKDVRISYCCSAACWNSDMQILIKIKKKT